MKQNAAYGVAVGLPNTSTIATASTIAKEPSRGHFKSQTPAYGIGKHAGKHFIVDDSVYEIPDPV